MDKLYRLAGAAGGSFICYGDEFGVRVNDLSLLHGIQHTLPPSTRMSSSHRVKAVYSFLSPPKNDNPHFRKFHLLYENAQLIERKIHGLDLLGTFENAVNLHVAQWARPYVFVHAGVVGWKGRAIVIPGASRSGKSTLVSAFLRAGAVFLSDEYAVFDKRGKVYPFSRPISLRATPELNVKVNPTDFGAITATAPFPVRMIIVAKYDLSSHWKPKSLTRGQALLSLLANAISARHRPDANVRILSTVVDHSLSLRGVRGDADETVDAIVQEFDKRA